MSVEAQSVQILAIMIWHLVFMCLVVDVIYYIRKKKDKEKTLLAIFLVPVVATLITCIVMATGVTVYSMYKVDSQVISAYMETVKGIVR